MVCKCSLVERLDLLPMAVLLMIGGKLSAQRAKSAHFVAVAHFGGLVFACLAKPVDGNDRVSSRTMPSCFPPEKGCDGRDILVCPA